MDDSCAIGDINEEYNKREKEKKNAGIKGKRSKECRIPAISIFKK